MSERKLFDESVIGTARNALSGLSGPVSMTLRKIVEELTDDIRAARSRGCPWDEIAKSVSVSIGADMQVDTLKQYARQKPKTVTQSASKTTMRKPRKPKPSAPAPGSDVTDALKCLDGA
jgi:hypothetical protein